MPDNQVALEVSSFLSSSAARRLEDVDRAQIRQIAEVFLEVCFEDLGKKPHLLHGDEMEAILRRFLPGRLLPKDPVAPSVGPVLRAFLEHLESRHLVSQAYELRQSLDESIDAFLAEVERGDAARSAPVRKKDPFVHGAPKLGRNDPCFCGSGKKFKKCHGKNS